MRKKEEGLSIWEEYWELAPLPPLDRWLSFRLKKYPISEQKKIAHTIYHRLRKDLPTWAQSEIEKRAQKSGWSKAQVQHFKKKLETPAPLWIRVLAEDKIDLIKSELSQLQLEVVESEHCPLTFKVRGDSALYQTQGHRHGWFMIQDLSSQLIVKNITVKKGAYIWDACAGRGGKTLLLASLMNNKGVLYATDVKETYLKENKLRVRTCQYSNVRHQVWDGLSALSMTKELAIHHGFDLVLVDAPCSSSGTWRKNPDAKLRVSYERIIQFPVLQEQILHHASLAVRPGGQLVYATCSFLVAENEDVVDKFLQTHPEFSLQKMELLGLPNEDSNASFVAVLIKN